MDVCGVNGSGGAGDRRYSVRRVWLPSLARESFPRESFPVIGPDRRPVQVIDDYLAWLTDCERSPNTVEAYAHDLRVFFTFLAEHGLSWDQVGGMELAEFAAWARRPARNVAGRPVASRPGSVGGVPPRAGWSGERSGATSAARCRAGPVVATAPA